MYSLILVELRGQTEIKYGTVRNSAVADFFKNAEFEPFQSMWVEMQDGMVDSSKVVAMYYPIVLSNSFVWSAFAIIIMISHHHFESWSIDSWCFQWLISQEGIEKVKSGGFRYVFIWEDKVLSYEASKSCDLTVIGPPTDDKGMAVAVPAGAMYLKDLSVSLLKMADTGVMEELKTK